MTDELIQNTSMNFDKFIEIPEHHPWTWYMKNDSPWIELISFVRDDYTVSAIYGHVRSWIEENSNGKIYIQFSKRINQKRTNAIDDGKVRYDSIIVILFDEPTDYTAFKIMFPELCRG